MTSRMSLNLNTAKTPADSRKPSRCTVTLREDEAGSVCDGDGLVSATSTNSLGSSQLPGYAARTWSPRIVAVRQSPSHRWVRCRLTSMSSIPSQQKEREGGRPTMKWILVHCSPQLGNLKQARV